MIFVQFVAIEDHLRSQRGSVAIGNTCQLRKKQERPWTSLTTQLLIIELLLLKKRVQEKSLAAEITETKKIITKEEITEIQEIDIKLPERKFMPKIGNPKPITDIPCDRCSSKRKVSKTWTEKIKNDHGFMVLYHTQIICTNKDCQSAFEKTLIEDTLKREKLKQIRLENSSKRIPSKTTI